MPYNDNLWHIHAHENISLPACLMMKLPLIEAWFGIQKSVADQAIDQWRVCLNACVKDKAKGKHYEHML